MSQSPPLQTAQTLTEFISIILKTLKYTIRPLHAVRIQIRVSNNLFILWIHIIISLFDDRTSRRWLRVNTNRLLRHPHSQHQLRPWSWHQVYSCYCFILLLLNVKDITSLFYAICISIGSLGKDGTKACVSNVSVYDSNIHDTSNGVRIKTWQVCWQIHFKT